ncbi:MAG: branched-chain amino acid ABC transporter permease [Acidimicrobiia bacterium]
MDRFVALTFAGLTQGAIASLIALGVVLLHNATGIVNFAQGDLLTLGGFLGFWLINDHKWSTLPAYLAVLILVFLVGVAIERVGYAPLKKQSQLAVMISTFALALGLRSVMIIKFDATNRSLPPPIGKGNSVVKIGGAQVPYQTFLVLVVTGIIFAGMMLLLHRTSIGRQVRALAVDRETALLQGIKVDRLSIIMFGASASLAALGGLLVGPVLPIGPEVGFSLLLSSFAATVLGGFDRVGGTVAAAFCVAIAQQYLGGYVSHNYTEAYPFIILLVALVLRPEGVIRGAAGVRY